MKTTAPASIHKLVETFEQNLDEYRSTKNETELRLQFLNPFFTALGWDVDNLQGARETEKEVAHEFSVEIDGQQKKADYAFRIKRDSAVAEKFDFLVEAKKPAVKIESDLDAAFQIRRYGWSARIPINILTDFEHFAVYDCRVKPKYGEKAEVSRQSLFHYKEYVERWDEIASLFSPEAVRAGSLSAYVKSIKGKRGTADVDDDFLQEIERWRELLAKNIASNNERLDVSGLNYAVQMIIDRIIFLRICEERSIEPENQLQDIANKENIYKELCSLFKRADTKYNSGLFHFSKEAGEVSRADDLTLNLNLDDKTLKDVILNLYYPKSPYAFLYIPSDILGQVYERFLGKVIRLTDGHRAKVEEKPEVRKAGGVFYTPTFIVTYIVINTLGKLLNPDPEQFTAKSAKNAKDLKNLSDLSGLRGSKKLTPVEVAKLKVVDPACGSGTFLLGAYQYLLDWHLKWYVENDPEKWASGKSPAIYQSVTYQRKSALKEDSQGGRVIRDSVVDVKGEWRLTTAKKKEILLNNIYGVDIDPQAVEVTKLSLLLKVLEDLNGQLTLGMNRLLPDLGNNIKCGNSLVGEDYFSEFSEMISQEERIRINALDWQEAFPEVFAQGGFDVVIGNPPYVRMEEFLPIKTYLKNHYNAHEERADFYTYFVELASRLINDSGIVGTIVSNKFSVAKYGKPLRATLQKNVVIHEIADFAGANVFKGATVRTFILFFSRLNSQQNDTTRYVPLPTKEEFEQIEQGILSVSEYANRSEKHLASGQLTESPWELVSADKSGLLKRLKNDFPPLRESFEWLPLFGIKTGLNEAFVINEETRNSFIRKNKSTADVIRPILFGKDVKRYSLQNQKRFVIYLHPDKDPNNYLPVKRHLETFRSELNNRAASQKWYELQQPSVSLLPLLAKPKIVYPIIAPEPRFTLDDEGFLINDKLFVLPTASLFLLGILNSSLANFFFSSICARLEGMGENYYEFRAQYVERFPIRAINFNDPVEKSAHDKIVLLVESMLSFHKTLASAQNPREKERLEKQIKSADEGIDKLVYELYGLSEEEIKIVEEKS